MSPVSSPAEFNVVGDFARAFPDPDTRTAILRLCIFLNVVHTLHTHLATLISSPPGNAIDRQVRAGHETVTLSFMIGVLKEGADVIRHASSRIDAIVRSLPATDPDTPVLLRAWDRIRAAVAKDDEQSLWNRVLKRIRDDAAFHWSANAIEACCAPPHANPFVFAVLRASPPKEVIRFTCADDILAKIAFGDTGHDALRLHLPEIQEFGAAAIVLLGTVIPAYLRSRGCTVVPV